MAHILLVEDDPQLGSLVHDFLESHGYAVEIEPRGDTAVRRILDEDVELVLLDLMLPGLDGLEVCKQVRDAGFRGAIVMLTARGDDIDEILGLQGGADDFLAKPVRPRVLLARVQAVLRRTAPETPNLELGTLNVEPASRSVTRDGRRLDLTTGEYELLVELAKKAGTVQSRDDLSMALRGVPWDGLDRSIDLRVSRLRKKLGSDGGSVLKSVRGAGYLLVPGIP